MTVFETLSEKLKEDLEKKNGGLAFYTCIWPKVVLLNSQERKTLIEKAIALNDKSPVGIGRLNTLLGMCHIFDANFVTANEKLAVANEQFRLTTDSGGIMASYCLMSLSYRSTGQLDKAQVYMQEALKICDNVKQDDPFSYFRSITCYQAGELSVMSKNFDSAKEYYEQGMKYVEVNPELEGRLQNALGSLLMHSPNWKSAIDYYERALEKINSSDNFLLESKILADIGDYFYKKNEFELALKNQLKSLDIRTKNNYSNPAITNYIHLAEIYLSLGEIEEAVRYGNIAVEAASKLNVLIKLYEAHEVLSKVYEKSGDIVRAFEHFRNYQKCKEEVHSRETIKKIEQLQNNHKIDLMEQEKEIFRLRNVELKSALDEITDSFRYARRIQTSLLPTEIYIEKTLKRLRNKEN